MSQGPNVTLSKSYNGEAAIGEYLIVKAGAAEDGALLSTAVSDKFLGVTQHSIDAANKPISVSMAGITKVIYGGTVADGDPLTTDSAGKAVVAAPATGVNNNLIGYARVAGVANDVGRMLHAQSVMQGA